MRNTLKAALTLLILSSIYYFAGCSSAEQTTAKLAYQQGDYAKAEAEFLKETQQNPNNEEAWFYLGMSRIQLNKLDAAGQAFKEYRKIGKNTFNSELINVWGIKYDEGYKQFLLGRDTTITKEEKMKYYTNALNAFKTALVILPDSTIAQKNIDVIQTLMSGTNLKPILDKGVEYEKAGNYEAAVNEYKKAYGMVQKGTPNYEIVIYDLGVAYLKWGEKMRTDSPDDPAFKDKYQLALPYLEELSTSTDIENQKLAWALLVQVYANLGMNEKAQDAIKKRDELNKK